MSSSSLQPSRDRDARRSPRRLGTESRFRDDTRRDRTAELSRAMEAQRQELSECLFKPQITAYAEVQRDRQESVHKDRSNSSTRSGQPIHERLVARARHAEARKNELRLQIEEARQAGVTFRPKIVDRRENRSSSVDAHRRLYDNATRQRRARMEREVERAHEDAEESEQWFQPQTNMTSSAIVQRQAELERRVGKTSDDVPDFYRRMMRADAIARDRRQALQRAQETSHSFKPFISPLSAAAVEASRRSRSADAARTSHRSDKEEKGDTLYREGVARMEQARRRAEADQHAREADVCRFAPQVNRRSAELAEGAGDALLQAGGLGAMHVDPTVPPVVERQLRHHEARKHHMEQFRKAAEEARAEELRRSSVHNPSNRRFSSVNASATSVRTGATSDAVQHAADLQLRGEVGRLAKEELASAVQAMECPFQPKVNPKSTELARNKRARASNNAENAPPPRYQAPTAKSTMALTSRHDEESSTVCADSRSEHNRNGLRTTATASSNPPDPAAFASFLEKQNRHLRKKELNIELSRRRKQQEEVAECTFRPHLSDDPSLHTLGPHHHAPPVGDSFLQTSAARRRRAAGAAYSQPGEHSHLQRLRYARQQAAERQRRQERIAQGRHPDNDIVVPPALPVTSHPPPVKVVQLSDGEDNDDVNSVARGRPTMAHRGAKQRDELAAGDTRRPSSAHHHRRLSSSGPAAEVLPFSFSQEHVDPLTGDVMQRAISNRHSARPCSANPAAVRKSSRMDTSAFSAARGSATGGAPSENHRSTSAAAAIGPDSVMSTIRKYVGRDTHVKRGFLY